MEVKDFLVVTTLFCSMLSVPTAGVRQPRLSLAEHQPSYYISNINGIPGTYSFGYDVLDPSTGNTQYRNEERLPNGTVIGGYGYLDANGRPMHFRYTADERGYRVSKLRPQPTQQIMTVPQYINREDTKTWSRKKLQHKQNKQKTNYNYYNAL